MIQSAAVQNCKFAVFIAMACTHFGHCADAANRRDTMAGGATITVERWTQAVLCRFNRDEIFQPQPEQFQFPRTDAG